KAGKPYTVFTPFRRPWQAAASWPTLLPPPAPQPAPACTATAVPKTIPGFQPMPLQGWHVPESFAHDRLSAFCQPGLLHRRRQRDYPAIDGTSRLSPYFALGILSPRQALLAAYNARQEYPEAEADIDTWIHELIWREFYIHILAAFPRVSQNQPFK